MIVSDSLEDIGKDTVVSSIETVSENIAKE
jgi:hypothetical protein